MVPLNDMLAYKSPCETSTAQYRNIKPLHEGRMDCGGQLNVNQTSHEQIASGSYGADIGSKPNMQ